MITKFQSGASKGHRLGHPSTPYRTPTPQALKTPISIYFHRKLRMRKNLTHTSIKFYVCPFRSVIVLIQLQLSGRPGFYICFLVAIGNERNVFFPGREIGGPQTITLYPEFRWYFVCDRNFGMEDEWLCCRRAYSLTEFVFIIFFVLNIVGRNLVLINKIFVELEPLGTARFCKTFLNQALITWCDSSKTVISTDILVLMRQRTGLSDIY